MFYSDLSISVSIEIKRNLVLSTIFIHKVTVLSVQRDELDIYLALLKLLFHFLNRFISHLFA